MNQPAREIDPCALTAKALETQRKRVTHCALQLEMANGYLDSCVGVAFTDPSKSEAIEDAREKQKFHEAQFFEALKEATGVEEKILRRILR